MNEVFRDYLRKFFLVFFYDILVYSASLEEHVQHLTLVLQRLQQHQLYTNNKKCMFAQEQVEYLGHIILVQEVSADPSQIEAMDSWPVPQTIKGLRGFLDLMGYYRKFVKGYGTIAKPLTDQLKKDAFDWSVEAQEAFGKLKKALCSVPFWRCPIFQNHLCWRQMLREWVLGLC
ncbi:uncharacterized mitochondrial protein AtMg00860-like [Humulus lupulus]|uniref:uncharacterized mitochondrial protein AtMg00860-like n=1 Tax=Humulus lupulus TaxID=3486 RepID=UPI002B407427|nr:uncharacterized mitochondrial protein AtMg00860-like [Humulus lupulus]